MSRGAPERSAVTFIDLEFDTGTTGGALLGDIATSLVSVDELLRDLAIMAAYPSVVAFRNIEIVAIEMRSPLKIRLSLFGISPEAVNAFKQICRDIILSREGSLPAEVAARITGQEAERLQAHIVALRNAAIPLRRVELTE